MSEFILMLTQNDRTVENALSVCREVLNREVLNVGLRYVGFKDIGLTLGELKELAHVIHDGGQKVMLEVVSLAKDEDLKAAHNATELGVDYLLGGTHAEEIASIVEGTGIQYFPFPGRVIGHPSQLRGSLEEIVASARHLASMANVQGLDLLAYRYDGNVQQLLESVVQAVDVPVIAAGSIGDDQRIRTVVNSGAWGFTVGSALFDGSYLPHSRYSLPAKIKRILALADQSGLAVDCFRR